MQAKLAEVLGKHQHAPHVPDLPWTQLAAAEAASSSSSPASARSSLSSGAGEGAAGAAGGAAGAGAHHLLGQNLNPLLPNGTLQFMLDVNTRLNALGYVGAAERMRRLLARMAAGGWATEQGGR